MNRRERGFSLLELLIVVAIILTLMLVAIPNVSKMRMTGNETSALKTIDTLRTVLFAYQTSYGTFPKDQSQLGPPLPGAPSGKDAADLVDPVLAPPAGTIASKDGYNFRYVAGPADSNGIISTYSVFGDPQSYNNTGRMRFFMDQTTRVHATTDGSEASVTSPLR